jgi:hypothetical protein
MAIDVLPSINIIKSRNSCYSVLGAESSNLASVSPAASLSTTKIVGESLVRVGAITLRPLKRDHDF